MELLPSSAKEWLTSVIWALIIYALMAVVMSLEADASSTSQSIRAKSETDTQKWKRIEQNRVLRREREHRYESCMQQCRKTCLSN